MKEPDVNDDVVVPGTSADAPNTSYLSVNSSTSSANGFDTNIMTLSLVGVIILLMSRHCLIAGILQPLH